MAPDFRLSTIIGDMEFARETRAILSMRGAWQEISGRIKDAVGTVAGDLKRVTTDAQASVDNLANSWTRATQALGKMLDAGGASKARDEVGQGADRAADRLDRLTKTYREAGAAGLLQDFVRNVQDDLAAAPTVDIDRLKNEDLYASQRENIAQLEARRAEAEKNLRGSGFGEAEITARLAKLNTELDRARQGLAALQQLETPDGQSRGPSAAQAALAPYFRKLDREADHRRDEREMPGIEEGEAEAKRVIESRRAAEKMKKKGFKGALPPLRPDGLYGGPTETAGGPIRPEVEATEIKPKVDATEVDGVSEKARMAGQEMQQSLGTTVKPNVDTSEFDGASERARIAGQQMQQSLGATVTPKIDPSSIDGFIGKLMRAIGLMSQLKSEAQSVANLNVGATSTGRVKSTISGAYASQGMG